MIIQKQCHKVESIKKIPLQISEQPVETEILIPEYCPDIARILKSEITPRLINVTTNNQSVTIEGCAEINIIFCSDEGKLSALNSKYNFTKTIDNSALEDAFCSVKLKCGKISARQTSARRIEIRGSILIDATALKKECEDIGIDFEDDSIEYLRKNVAATTNIGFNEKSSIIEENLPLLNGSPEIKYIFRQQAKAFVNEAKIVGDKAVVKGNIKVDIIYCDINDCPVKFPSVIPFSQIIDLNNEGEDCTVSAKANIALLDIHPYTDGDGITNSFNVAIKLIISIKSYCDSDIPIIEDAYSTKYNTDITTKKLNVKKRVDIKTEKILVKKNLEFSGRNIKNVIDLWSESEIKSFKTENKSLNINGTLNVSILVLEEDNSPNLLEKSFDYEYSCALNSEEENLQINPSVSVFNNSYTIVSGDSIEVQAELVLSADLYKETAVSYITDIELNEKTKIEGEQIVAYFMDENEDLWSVAKKFKTSVELIKKENNILDDSIPNMLIIPIM